jgi:hypothetical protein
MLSMSLSSRDLKREGLSPKILRKTLERFRQVRDGKPLCELMSFTLFLGTIAKTLPLIDLPFLSLSRPPSLLADWKWARLLETGNGYACGRLGDA